MYSFGTLLNAVTSFALFAGIVWTCLERFDLNSLKLGLILGGFVAGLNCAVLRSLQQRIPARVLLRNLAMLIVALAAAGGAFFLTGWWLRPAEIPRGGYAVPTWRPFLAGLAAGWLVIRLFRVATPKAASWRRDTPATQGTTATAASEALDSAAGCPSSGPDIR
jgi:hypothetical protein